MSVLGGMVCTFVPEVSSLIPAACSTCTFIFSTVVVLDANIYASKTACLWKYHSDLILRGKFNMTIRPHRAAQSHIRISHSCECLMKWDFGGQSLITGPPPPFSQLREKLCSTIQIYFNTLNNGLTKIFIFFYWWTNKKKNRLDIKIK